MTRKALPAAATMPNMFGEYCARLVKQQEPIVRLSFSHDDRRKTQGTLDVPAEDIANALRRSGWYHVETVQERRARILRQRKHYVVSVPQYGGAPAVEQDVHAHAVTIDEKENLVFKDAEGDVSHVIQRGAWSQYWIKQSIPITAEKISVGSITATTVIDGVIP